jgi:DNA-binding FadR family transcriptional regulator
MALGWPVGHRLGSERELMARHGVSRAVLREAIRLLEHHMVVRMRSGRGGGLVTTKPDADAVARAMSIYLSFARVQSGQLAEVRAMLESHAVEQAASQASEAERLELRRLLTGEVAAVTAHAEASNDFHLRLAEMTHNPVLYLFIRCLIDLTAQRTEPGEDRARIARRVNEVHVRIAEAVIAGDGALARYRMGTHIGALTPWWRDPAASTG